MKKIAYVLAIVVLIALAISSTAYSKEDAASNVVNPEYPKGIEGFSKEKLIELGFNSIAASSDAIADVVNPLLLTAEELKKISKTKNGKSAPPDVPIETSIASTSDAGANAVQPPMPSKAELEKISKTKNGKSAPEEVPLQY